jgi:PAS domain S-box-containing protein
MHTVARALYKGVEEAALNEQTYREIFNATSDAIFIHEAERGRTVDVNRAACALAGLSRAELLGQELKDVPLRDEDGNASHVLKERIQRARSEGFQVFESRAARKDGSERWLEITLHAARIRGQECVLAAVREISDPNAAAEQVRAAERLKSLGQLAGSVAHDFNNQLTGIVSSATLLKEKLRTNPAAQLSLDLILQCSQRSADLTRQLLAFARKGDRREDVVDVESLVAEVVALLERSIDKRVTISVDVACREGARVIGDASFLASALVNLGLNARDAMPQGGALRFEIRRVREAELPERAREQLSPSDSYVQVSVCDTGVGIAPDVLGHVFEPFFTTKIQGSGLGLSAAHGTAQAHGGALLVTSALGVGTTFDLFLPATDRPAQAAPERRPNGSARRVRVLLAEDEPEVGRATELVLQELGCVVTWRRDGRAALDAFEREPDAFDVAILDHSMPRMLGSEVGERITALRPRMWIIAISGFAEDARSDPDRPQRIFLPKPFGVEQLAAALDQALASRSDAGPPAFISRTRG